MRSKIMDFVEVIFTILIGAALVATFVPSPAQPLVYTKRPPLGQVDAKLVAKELLTPRQYKCFNQLLTKESHWNSKAKNPTSSAIGVGQLLDSTYKNLGMKHSKTEVAQTVAALAYIGRKYGSAGPCGAWEFWQKNYWY